MPAPPSWPDFSFCWGARWTGPGPGKFPPAPREKPALESSTRGQELRKGRWTELVHPDDRRRVEALLSAHLDGWSHVFEAQYRIQDAPATGAGESTAGT